MNGLLDARSRQASEVRLSALAEWLAEFVLNEPLLPPVLASRLDTPSSVHVVVRTPSKQVLFRSAGRPPSTAATASRMLSGEGAVNGLDGFSVEVSTAPSAAERLVIGGLPRSRTTFLYVLLALSLGLAAASVRQIQRERRLAEIRQDFVTRASHELRTPVARIRMFIETLLLDRARTEEERRQALQAIDRASRRLAFLIENVLRFQEGRTGAAALRLEPSGLGQLAREAVAELDPAGDLADRVTVSVHGGVSAPVDRESFRRILANLIDNAAKYSGRTDPTQIDILESADEALIRVADRGPGVPDRARHKIWLPYFRLERDRRSAVCGAVVSRHELMRTVWGYPSVVITRTVDTHIAELRRKLEPNAAEPRHIVTVPKAGYRLDE